MSDKKYEFRLGDTVQLKSGGPVMTVTEIWDPSYAPFGCKWFNNDNELKEKSFAGVALIVVPAPKKP